MHQWNLDSFHFTIFEKRLIVGLSNYPNYLIKEELFTHIENSILITDTCVWLSSNSLLKRTSKVKVTITNRMYTMYLSCSNNLDINSLTMNHTWIGLRLRSAKFYQLWYWCAVIMRLYEKFACILILLSFCSGIQASEEQGMYVVIVCRAGGTRFWPN